MPPATAHHEHAIAETETNVVAVANAASTLIEFPGQTPRPQWRKDLSLRVREIQERRARETPDAPLATSALHATNGKTSATKNHKSNGANNPKADAARQTSASLGLVPPIAETPLNPIVAAALRRVERARQHSIATSNGAGVERAPMPLNEPPLAVAPQDSIERTAQFDDAENDDVAENFALPMTFDETSFSSNDFATSPQANESLDADELTTEAVTDTAAHTSKLLVLSASTADQSLIGSIAQTTIAPPLVETLSAAAPLHINVQPEDFSNVEIPLTKTTSREANEAMMNAAVSNFTHAIESSTAHEITSEPIPKKRVFIGVVDDVILAQKEFDECAKLEALRRDSLDDRASLGSRVVASIIDLFLVGFAVSPVAATIEFSYGVWSDPFVWYLMLGASAIVMFLYSLGATAFAGRTFGMKLVGVRPVEVFTGLSPSASQSVKRAFFWMLSFAALGLGLLYALIDPERRGVHDHLSGTLVVRD